MKNQSFLSNLKLTSDAKTVFTQYMKEVALYQNLVAESTYEELVDDVIAHLENKIEASHSKQINSAEAKQILDELGQVDHLLGEVKVPKLIRIPLLGSFAGTKQLFARLTLYTTVLFCAVGLTIGSWYFLRAIFSPEPTLTAIPNQQNNRSQWTVTKRDVTQQIELLFPTQYMQRVMVYYGKNLKSNEIFIQFTGNNGYALKTTEVRNGTVFGKLQIELFPEQAIVPTPECALESNIGSFYCDRLAELSLGSEGNSNARNWATGYQELLIFIPQELNYKGTFNKYIVSDDTQDGTPQTLVEMYLQTGITPYVTPERGEYDSNSMLGYAERVKNAGRIGVQLDYLGKFETQ